MNERKTRDLCQSDWQEAHPGEYFPYGAERVDTCSECGYIELVARSVIADEAKENE